MLLTMPRAQSVLIIGSEALPFAKTGGLADIPGALPVALARLGWDVTLALPKYRGVSGGSVLEQFPVTVGGFTRDVSFIEAPMADGARALLIDCPELFDCPALYGTDSTDYPDNPLRFAFLVRAALEFAARLATKPSLVHAHDWQAGLAPVYLATLYASHPTLGGMPSVFTIHNLAYQGVFDSDWLPRLDFGWELFTVDELEFWGRISFLKGAINHADTLTTVSPRYAEQIQTPELGFGFDGILRARASNLVGILNGIDTRDWDPARDRFLPTPYDADHLEAKSASKAALLEQYGLATDDAAMKRPLVCHIPTDTPMGTATVMGSRDRCGYPATRTYAAYPAYSYGYPAYSYSYGYPAKISYYGMPVCLCALLWLRSALDAYAPRYAAARHVAYARGRYR